MSKVFDYVKAINTKQAPDSEIQSVIDGDEFAKVALKDFSSFLTNRNFSQYPDTVLVANELNRYWMLPERAKFLYYYHGLPQKKRFAPWAKKDQSDQETIDLIKELYNYSDGKAREVLPMMTNDDIELMKKKLNKGGKQ